MNTLATDRGLHYGDGLFETLRVVDGAAPLWDWHHERLLAGCARLRLPAPDEARLRRTLRSVSRPHRDCVVKLIWTAGSGQRGYARPPEPAPRLLASARPWQPLPAAALRLRWCATRLALQPALAGIKHLNRLEQVLARAEWDEDYDEGLMLDMQGRVVAATAANVFVRHGGQWLTPPVAECGIAGVARRWMLQTAAARECALSLGDIESADALVLTNAVRGPRQVGQLGERRWRADAGVRRLRAAWDALFAGAA